MAIIFAKYKMQKYKKSSYFGFTMVTFNGQMILALHQKTIYDHHYHYIAHFAMYKMQKYKKNHFIFALSLTSVRFTKMVNFFLNLILAQIQKSKFHSSLEETLLGSTSKADTLF